MTELSHFGDISVNSSLIGPIFTEVGQFTAIDQAPKREPDSSRHYGLCCISPPISPIFALKWHGLCIFALWRCTFGPYLGIQCRYPRSERVIWSIAGLGFTWYHQIRAPGPTSRDIHLGHHTGIDPRTHTGMLRVFLHGATA
jgi:hypothetical protein